MELYYAFSVLIVLASIFSYLNVRYLKFPSTIGVMLIAMAMSIALVVLGNIYPVLLKDFSHLLKEVDFTEVLMGSMLNFLLFAGAIHINLSDLREQKASVIIFSSVSVVISTFAIGSILFYALPYLSINMPLLYCLLFGALISPTDPIAVLGILKEAKVPKSLETKVAGESLFNDGVAVVVFIVILKLTQGDEIDITFGYITWLFVKEALGGILLGIVLGMGVTGFLNKVNDYKVSVLMTLSVVMGGYLVAHSLHISGPLTMVSAGLFLGNYGKNSPSLTSETKDYVNKFWEIIDDILNAILFLFIGFELLLIPKVMDYWLVGLVAIVVVLTGRFLSIFIPAKMIPFNEKFDMPTIRILVWGGLRGGVSIALALSISSGPYKELIISITYFVVVFSIVVQGLTIGKLANKTLPKE